jgi:hypothetical protein
MISESTATPGTRPRIVRRRSIHYVTIADDTLHTAANRPRAGQPRHPFAPNSRVDRSARASVDMILEFHARVRSRQR